MTIIGPSWNELKPILKQTLSLLLVPNSTHFPSYNQQSPVSKIRTEHVNLFDWLANYFFFVKKLQKYDWLVNHSIKLQAKYQTKHLVT